MAERIGQGIVKNANEIGLRELLQRLIVRVQVPHPSQTCGSRSRPIARLANRKRSAGARASLAVNCRRGPVGIWLPLPNRKVTSLNVVSLSRLSLCFRAASCKFVDRGFAHLKATIHEITRNTTKLKPPFEHLISVANILEFFFSYFRTQTPAMLCRLSKAS